jgi:16S rRNA (cytosine1402-N4)-methyltransferase
MEFSHVTVLLKETVDMLECKEGSVVVDCTLGGGGHSLELCKRIGPSGRLIAIDQDINAINHSKEKLAEFKNRITFVHDNFTNIKAILDNLNIEGVDGIIADLGVSSHQLDEAERGFSYMQDAPLDMRMDTSKGITAKDIVNEYNEQQLTDIISKWGEENWAKRIAKFIVEFRESEEITTTGQLVDIIKRAIPAKARQDGPHPAKRTFQAIRIAVNNELDIIQQTITEGFDKLKSGGRMGIITFHSLEDRIVKQTYQSLSVGCVCPPKMPICICNKKPVAKIITRKPMLPSEYEVNENPRSRSAKLRVAEKI